MAHPNYTISRLRCPQSFQRSHYTKLAVIFLGSDAVLLSADARAQCGIMCDSFHVPVVISLSVQLYSYIYFIRKLVI